MKPPLYCPVVAPVCFVPHEIRGPLAALRARRWLLEHRVRLLLTFLSSCCLILQVYASQPQTQQAPASPVKANKTDKKKTKEEEAALAADESQLKVKAKEDRKAAKEDKKAAKEEKSQLRVKAKKEKKADKWWRELDWRARLVWATTLPRADVSWGLDMLAGEVGLIQLIAGYVKLPFFTVNTGKGRVFHRKPACGRGKDMQGHAVQPDKHPCKRCYPNGV